MKKKIYLFLIFLVILVLIVSFYFISARSVKKYLFEPYVYDASYDNAGYEESYTNENGTVYLSDLVVPYINIESDDAKKSNEEIKDLYSRILNAYKSYNTSTKSMKLSINYNYFCTGKILSVVITYRGFASEIEEYKTFNFDLKDGHLLTYKEVYERFGFDSNSIREKLDLIIKDKFKKYVNDYSIENSTYDNNAEKGNINFYINDKDFNVCVWLLSQNVMINVNEEISYNENIDDDQRVLNDIVKNDLYVFGGKKSLNELSNKEKLWFSFKKFFGFSKDSFTGNDLVKKFKDTSIGDLGIVLDDIGYYSDNCITYEYDYKTDIYSRTANCGRSIWYVDFVYVDVSDYKIVDGKYNVSAKYLWYYDQLGFYGNVYSSYNDALNNKNSIYTFKDTNKITRDEVNRLLEHEKIETYNFTFEKKDDKFKLVDFNVTK